MQTGDDFPGNSQQSYTSDYTNPAVDSAYSTQQQQQQQLQQQQLQQQSQQSQQSQHQHQQPNGSVSVPDNEPPRKRARVTMTPADSFGAYGQNMDAYAAAFPGSPTEPNESFVYTQSAMNERDAIDQGIGPSPPLPHEVSPDVELKRSMLMGLFMDSTTEESSHEMLQTLTPLELDMPIDPQSHTALHWAATLARMPLLRALIAVGASPRRVNASGETALMRACLVTNSMDQGSFPDLLEVLGGTIEFRDHKGRTVLHHIAVTSAVKGRNAASRYYLESLLEWVVRRGSVPNSQATQLNGNGINGSQSVPKMGIARFMSEIVNAQDSSGDTALNIAARIGNRSIISQLLEVGADPEIANRVGLRPLDFGIGGENADGKMNGDATAEKSGAPGSSQRSRESSDEIIECKSKPLPSFILVLFKPTSSFCNHSLTSYK